MRRLLIFLLVFIVFTSGMLIFITKNYSYDIVEISLKNYAKPELVATAMENAGVTNYLSIYDLLTESGKESVIDGNDSIMLSRSKIDDAGITKNANEILLGEKYEKKYCLYSMLGKKYSNDYGNYYVNAIIKNNDRIYYRDTKILDKAQISHQNIFFSIKNVQKYMLDAKIVTDVLDYYKICPGKYVAYNDIIIILKKINIILIETIAFIAFAVILGKNKKIINELRAKYVSLKYDLYLKDFIKKSENKRLILRVAGGVLTQLVLAVFIIGLYIIFSKQSISYSIDFTSTASVIKAVFAFFSLIKYYFINGFTEGAFLIFSITASYILLLAICIIISYMIKCKAITKVNQNNKLDSTKEI